MKRLINYSLFLLCASILLFSCNQKDNVKYYRHLRMYKIHDLAFSYPVDPMDHKKINCYAVEYDESDRIVNIVYLRGEKPAFNDFSKLASVNIEYINNNEKWYRLNLEGESIFKNVEYESYDFDSTGRLQSHTNYSIDDTVIEDTAGIATYLYTTDSLNNVLTRIGLNINSESTVDSNGYYKLVFKYDNNNNFVETANFDGDDRYFQGKEGVALARYKYDEYNNCTEINFYDSTNTRAFNRELRAFRISYQYDENGNMIRSELLDDNDNLLYNSEHGCSFYEISYNNRGDINSVIKYFDENTPSIKMEFIDGRIYKRIEYAIIGRQEQFEDESYDYHSFIYDSKGNEIEIGYYNSDGSPYTVNRGFAIVRNSYDNMGNRTEISSYSALGYLTEDLSTGIAIHRYKYDKNNHKIETAKYGANGNLKNGKDDWIAKIISEYDYNGIPLEVSYFGMDGSLRAPKGQNWARQIFYYDDKKRPKGFGFHGERDELVMNESFGFAYNIIEYDDEVNMNKYKTCFFDEYGDLIGESMDPPPPFKP